MDDNLVKHISQVSSTHVGIFMWAYVFSSSPGSFSGLVAQNPGRWPSHVFLKPPVLTKPTKAKAAVKNFQAICWQLPWAIRQAKVGTNYQPPLAQSNYLQDSPQQACQMDSVSIYNLIWLTSTRISNDLGPTPSLKSLPPNDQSKCLAAVSASRQLSTSNDCCRAEESWSCLVRTANSGWQSFIVPVQ